MQALASVVSLVGISLLISCDSDSGTTWTSEDVEEIARAYAGKETVSIRTVSGGCQVRVGPDDSIRVHLEHAHVPPGVFEARFGERERSLLLEEVFDGSTSSGYSTWTVTVPAGTTIEFSSASGDLEIEGLEGGVEASIASGDVEIRHFQGELQINTASGDVDLEEISGALQIHTASGEIEITDVTLEAESSFASASGDVEVKLARSAAHDLSVASASGDAILDYDGNAILGRFVFTAKVNGGRIVSPFAFDSEERFTQHEELYDRKSFTRDGDTPTVTIATASGKAQLRQ